MIRPVIPVALIRFALVMDITVTILTSLSTLGIGAAPTWVSLGRTAQSPVSL